jgi:hypothetical protein
LGMVEVRSGYLALSDFRLRWARALRRLISERQDSPH